MVVSEPDVVEVDWESEVQQEVGPDDGFGDVSHDELVREQLAVEVDCALSAWVAPQGDAVYWFEADWGIWYYVCS